MIKNFLSVLMFLFISTFIYFIFSTYYSDQNKKKINSNRVDSYEKITENIKNLPKLPNNTNDVIKFNSGYEKNHNKIKRNFWNLFKKND
tara:strand:+ start:418 stop:684 length:267 start_codon:yes stop_codon:yes gene_type:complete